jgi:predicted transcriptional regulator
MLEAVKMTMVCPKSSSRRKKYRSQQEIIYTILNTMGQQGTTITKIFYGSMTSYEQCREYLDDLIKLNMVAFDKKARLYRVNAKGEHFMQIYSVLRLQLGEHESFLP